MHIHTHYDNLQVPYTATDAEIRQAYRRLSRKYHPDLNPDPDAHRIMQLVNRAYDVLSDPRKRAEHDFWIEAQRRRRIQEELGIPTTLTYAQRRNMPNQYNEYQTQYAANNSQKLVLIGLIIISLILLGLVIWQGQFWFNSTQNNMANNLSINTPSTETPTEKVYIESNHNNTNNNNNNIITTEPETIPLPSNYIRPHNAPNGSPFPVESGYIEGYPQIIGLKNYAINVENIHNTSDVFAQLYEKRSSQAVRTFFINTRSEFMLNQLDPGEYFVRYYQLDNGEYFDSESVTVTDNSIATIYLQRARSRYSQ